MSDLPKMYRAEGPDGQVGDLVIWPKGQKAPTPALDPASDQTFYSNPAEARAAARKVLAEKAAKAPQP